MAQLPIYLDNHATTCVDPRVLEAMLPYFCQKFGNAGSASHVFGWEARAAVEKAREQVAALIGARAHEIVFTSGATESNNIAIKGVARALLVRGDHIITSAIEHKSVLDSFHSLQDVGFRVTVLPVDGAGQVDPADVERAIDARTTLVSVMAANNETGVIQPVAEIARICTSHGIIFHTDAVQAAGKIPFDVGTIAADFVSLSAHKIYGPKGIGALYVRERDPRLQLPPLIHGGGQEGGIRSGTLAVQNIVGLGMAAELSRLELQDESGRLCRLRNRLRDGILGRLDSVYVNGHAEQRLPGNLNMSFVGVEAESILLR